MSARGHRRGLLVALEGIDGAGKSTLQRVLAGRLRRRGYAVRRWHEPVDARLGRLAQETSVDDPWTGAIYFTLDRQLARPKLLAELGAHDLVLSDRSLYSTLAYQGSALPPSDRERLEELQREATVWPDRVLFLDLPPTLLARRLEGRARQRGPLERARALARVARAYRRLARGRRWTTLDARAPLPELVRQALAALAPVLGARHARSRGKKLRRSVGPRRAP